MPPASTEDGPIARPLRETPRSSATSLYFKRKQKGEEKKPASKLQKIQPTKSHPSTQQDSGNLSLHVRKIPDYFLRNSLKRAPGGETLPEQP